MSSDWDAIRHFLHAARARSLSGAARSLGVEHSTVGRRIAALERALGGALVDRKPSGLVLTPLGRRALRLAEEMDRAARALGGLAHTDAPSVRVVVPTGFSALLTPHLASLAVRTPGVTLDIVSGAKRVELRRGSTDAAIRVGPVDDPELVVRKLGEVGSALYASRRYLGKRSVDPDDLAGHAVIAFHRSLSALPAAEWLAARTAGSTVVLRGRDAADMVSAARSGAGLAVLPCFLADAEPDLVRLTPRPVALRRVSLVYRREARLSAPARAVLRFIVETLQEHAAELRGQP
jgi:DNA-binding transcriptional LysR family regulator